MGKRNLRWHEVLGLFYQFLGATSIGYGIYVAVWIATRSIYLRQTILVSGWEWLYFPLLFGIGGVLWSLGGVELKEASPGYWRGKRK